MKFVEINYNVAVDYQWAYKVSSSDKNYSQRQDKSLDYYFYDSDSNEKIEEFKEFILKNPSLRGVRTINISKTDERMKT